MNLIKKVKYVLAIVVISLFTLNITSNAATVEVTTETLNLRKEATTESDIVAQISIGEECEVLGEEGDWYKIQYDEYTGYVSKEYVKVVGEDGKTTPSETTPSEEPDTPQTEEPTGETETTNEPEDEKPTTETETSKPQDENDSKSTKSGKLNRAVDLRLVPLINASRVEALKNNTAVIVIEELNGWSYVQTTALAGWVRSDAITIDKKQNDKIEDVNTEPVDNENNTDDNKDDEQNKEPDNNSDNVSSFEEKTMYSTDYINIRKGPSTSRDAIMTVAPNTELKVIGESGDWYEVETSEGNAYVLKELLSDSKVEVTNRGNVDRTEINKKEDSQTEKENNTKEEGKKEEAETEQVSTSNTSKNETSATASKIVAYAKKYLGVPYVYGGASPAGFDCSGFTMYVFDHFGISMRHGAQAQAKLGEKVSADKSSKASLLKNLKVGDLVFFLDYETMDEIGHCGIYIGNGDFIHASSGSGYCVKINSLLPGEYYNTRYCAARRVL